MNYERVARYYERNKKQLLKKAERKVGSQECEDIVHEVFLRMIAFYHKFDPDKGKFNAWVSGILRNCIKDWEKEQRERANVTGVINNKDYVEPSYEDNSVEQTQDVGKLLNKIANKARPARDILYLRFIKQYNNQEIAKTLGLKEKNVRMHIMRFRKEINK